MKTVILSMCCAAGLASAAGAGTTTVLTSFGNTLFVTQGGSTTSFPISDDLTSMAVAPDGTIWATSQTDNDNDGFYEIYTITNPTTAPTLNPMGDFLLDNTPSLTFINGQMYGLQKVAGQDNDTRLITINPGAMTQATVGNTGIFNINANGLGYDAPNDTLYTMSKGPIGDTWTLDYTAVSPADPTNTLVGSLGERTNNHGAEFYDGVLYVAIQDIDELNPGMFKLRLGTVDAMTGDWTELEVLADNWDQANGLQVGVAVIPTPGALALASFAGIAGLRRKR